MKGSQRGDLSIAAVTDLSLFDTIWYWPFPGKIVCLCVWGTVREGRLVCQGGEDFENFFFMNGFINIKNHSISKLPS